MLKREFRINFKNFCVWLFILVGIFALVYLMYPSITNSENSEMLNEVLKSFPKDLLVAFNMDITDINTVFGWLKSEGYIFILLITSAYAAIMGSNIALKEENDMTIEYLNSLPISRNRILTNKIICGLSYIVLMVLCIGVFNIICLFLSGTFDMEVFLLLSLAPIFTSIVTFLLCLFLSTFTHKTKNMLGISLGIVFISYFLQIVSNIAEQVEFLKYVSIFTLADTRNIIINGTIDNNIIIVSAIISLVLLICTYINYNRKELI